MQVGGGSISIFQKKNYLEKQEKKITQIHRKTIVRKTEKSYLKKKKKCITVNLLSLIMGRLQGAQTKTCPQFSNF